MKDSAIFDGVKCLNFRGSDDTSDMVGFFEFKGNLYLATLKRVYVLDGDAFSRLFEEPANR